MPDRDPDHSKAAPQARGDSAPEKSVVVVNREGTVAIVTLDNSPVNAASHAVRAGLADAVRRCDADPDLTAVVLICAGRTFIAGADVREFGAPAQPPVLGEVVDAIEGARLPWVAAIHGSALGGGLEIAMGCHARIAAAEARFGLPEVGLGLIPGAGGTVRLPRLVGADLALTMVAGGKPIGAEAALAAGLIDGIAAGDLMAGAVEMARRLTAPRRTLSLPPRAPEDRAAFDAAAETWRRRARGQHSVPEAVDAVLRGLTLPPTDAVAAERAAFLRLKDSAQSAALRHIFFAERASLSDPRCKGMPRPVDRIAVVGGGTMGAGIAVACLLADLTVTLIERTREAAEAGHGRVARTLAESAARGAISPERQSAALSRLTVSQEMTDAADADLAIEAVFEDMDAKLRVFAALEAVTHPDAVLATNTSYLDVDRIAAGVADPSRVIGLHFFSPAHVMKLLEIVLPAGVADDVVATAATLARRLGKIGVLSGVCDGFIGNRIMSAYRREADCVVEDGAMPWDVDAAMRAYGFPIGVFEMQDLAGLDIGWAMRKRRAATRDPRERYVHIADRLCEAGRFGRKTGHGFYDHDTGRAVPSDFVAEIVAEERARKGIAAADLDADAIMDRVLSALRAEARWVLDDGTARSAADIDVVMVNGYGYPRWRGGPMFGQP